MPELKPVSSLDVCELLRRYRRDLVNMVSGVKNGSHPNDIYDHCDEIDRIIDAALEGGGR